MALVEKDDVVGKVCSHCKEWKPLDEFPTDPTHGPTQGGKHCICRECHKHKYHLNKCKHTLK